MGLVAARPTCPAPVRRWIPTQIQQGCGSLILRLGHALGLGQPWRQDPHELRGRLRAHLRPCIGQVVLHRRRRQAEAMSGSLLRPGVEHRGDHADLTVGGASGSARRPSRHALRSQSKGSAGSASRMVIGWSLVEGLSLSPRPNSRSFPISNTAGKAASSPTGLLPASSDGRGAAKEPTPFTWSPGSERPFSTSVPAGAWPRR
jgi:hypothetical protein